MERSVDRDITHAFKTVRDHLAAEARMRDRRALRRIRPPSVRRLNIGHASRYHGRRGITIALDDARRGLADEPYDLNDGLVFPFPGPYADGHLAQYANALFHENVHYVSDSLTRGKLDDRQAQGRPRLRHQLRASDEDEPGDRPGRVRAPGRQEPHRGGAHL